ncbi:inositol monophosphatase family protein [Halarcobacter bivalviorum]|uniref:Inositol monophosphatase family protein n=1 Tax=Halarcobacter bivalviorum TaxID=663364 RepID=A0AAX2ACC9_9BACT|nr:inositol monophosphatase family protein [Halarcobacter bivalviorum]AXH11839.1 inositol monophosphatase family protein [Halarcobacter bivalviorum]RXK10963.1 inositol phosphatase [Halarcobacter bivalviorum]
MFDYNSFTKAVIQANKELYGYINTHMTQADLQESSQIGFGGDKTLQIDIIAENIFIKYLSSFGDIFSEEIGRVSNNSNIKIIIDPLDGSHNFSSGLEYYGTSVAVKKNDKYIAGYVCNLSTAVLIFREDEEVNKINILSEQYLGFYEIENPNIAIFERAYDYPSLTEKLKENSIKFRSPGAAALSLANARNYKFVLFAGKLREFDIAASLYINQELYIYQNDEFLIITKNYTDFILIKEIIKLF